MARIIAVANQKGGVGKTTTTVNAAAALGELGITALVIDLDPQCNATLALGIARSDTGVSSYDVLMSDGDIAGAIRPTNSHNVSCLPASPDLAGAEVELVAIAGREHQLQQALTPVAEQYDVILIDCPPSLGLLTVNALVAATELLVPIQAEFYALDGVGQLVRTTELVRAALNPELEISMVVLTMVGPSSSEQSHVVEEVSAYFGQRLATTLIPRDYALSAAPSVGKTALAYAPDSVGARSYTALATEIAAATPSRKKVVKL